MEGLEVIKAYVRLTREEGDVFTALMSLYQENAVLKEAVKILSPFAPPEIRNEIDPLLEEEE